MTRHPVHGFTRHGHPVHGRTTDHHPTDTRYERFNKRVAVAITRNVGTMTCAWLFCVLALASLPATLVAAGVLPLRVLPVTVIGSAGFILVVSWAAQSFIQLVLLPAIMVGQNLQSDAADARATKTFEDVETVLDRLNENTEGGIKTVLDAIGRLGRSQIDLHDKLDAKPAKVVAKPVAKVARRRVSATAAKAPAKSPKPKA